MKSLFRLPNFLLLAVAIFGFNACTEDPTFVLGPSTSLLSGTGYLTTDATVDKDATFTVNLSASKGDNPMNTVEFLENGSRISDISRITINGSPATSSAILLADAEKDALDWVIEIQTEGTDAATYQFLVTDEAGETSSESLTISIAVDPISLTLSGSTMFTTTPGSLYGLPLTATQGASAITTLSVFENGAEITEADRLFFGELASATPFTSPLTLAEADQGGFEKSLYIRSNTASGSYDYTITITDANGETSSVSVTFDNGTALEGDFSGVLLNKSGAAGQGGLDLDTGNGNINSTSVDAEIKDEGIDLALPASSNWKQKISGANGSVLRYLAPASLPENFSFGNISSKEEIAAIYDAGATQAVSNVVQIGDIFAVYNAGTGRTYLLEVTNKTLTTNDNLDSYTFNIKW